jgi:hypothetical protein
MPGLDVPSLIGRALGDAVKNLYSVSRDAHGLVLSGRIPPGTGPGLRIQDLRLGDGGVSGRFTLDGLVPNDPPKYTPFEGFDIFLTGLDVTLTGGNVSAARITGRLTIPFFKRSDGTQQQVDVDIGFGPGGRPSITLSAHQSAPATRTPDGLVTLDYPLPASGRLILSLASLTLDTGPDGVARLTIGGKLAVTAGGVNWPEAGFRALRIDAHGRVEVEGGWLALPARLSLDFFGFHLGLQKIALGTNSAGHPCLSMNGEINLVEGIPLGGSVRGLEIDLASGALAFAGVSVSFEIPGVLKFTGSIDHFHANTSADWAQYDLPALIPAPGDVFLGGVRVEFTAVPGLEIDARLIVGNITGMSIFFLAFDLELPVGLALFPPALALFGIHGLFASNLRPDPVASSHTWWEWYKYPPGGPSGIDTSQEPPPGAGSPWYDATFPQKWLAPRAGAFAFGAGATIGTLADNGFAASAAITLVLLLPGPVIQLIGKARLLSKRVSAAADADPPGGLSLDALAVFDGEAETFDLAIEARYRIPVLVEIDGAAAIHADTKKGQWYFALGLPPRERRVRARVFDLFEADSFFVISDRGVTMGAYVGYAKQIDLGPVSVGFNIFIAGIAAVQWSPPQLGAGLELHGEAYLHAFGLSLGLSVDALLEATAPNPFWIHGEFTVTISLPWPLPDIHCGVSLTWGSDTPAPPTGANLARIEAVLSDHAGVGDRYDLLLDHPPAPPPVVPTDSHFILHFAHPTLDAAGFRNSGAVPEEPAVDAAAGDLPKDDMSHLDLNPHFQWIYRRSVKRVTLLRHGVVVAAKPRGTAPAELDGTWLPPERRQQDNQPVPTTFNVALKVIPPSPGLLPDAHSDYVLEVETAVEAQRTDRGVYQPADEDGGHVRQVFFRTAGVPGLASRTGQNRPVFPDGGPLLDLGSYVVWSWPEDGAEAAYFGYDVVFEFNEPYIHQLYAEKFRGLAGETVHFRCLDRAGRWVMLDPFGVNTVTVAANAALLGELLAVRRSPSVEKGTSPIVAEARRLWPDQFRPRTHYTLDLVPGPATFDGLCLATLSAADAVDDLTEIYKEEAALFTLARSGFTTSRYATFSDHLKPASGQTAFRRFPVAHDPVAWLAGNRAAVDQRQTEYNAARADLETRRAGYHPFDDALNPVPTGEENHRGQAGLKAGREEVAGKWRALSDAVAALFDRFVRESGRPDLASDQHAPPPPNTEASLLAGGDGTARAVLLESPEPLDWRRVTAAAEQAHGPAAPPVGLTVLWNVDATRAVLIPGRAVSMTDYRLRFTYHGDIGAEAPAVSHCGDPVREEAVISPR